MARAAKPKPIGATPIEAIVHPDKRTNIPTADAQEFLGPEAEEIATLLYPRDPSLDPQLVWKGKDEQDRRDLAVDVPPIYIQEKIDPRVLIENLRRTAATANEEPELRLFESFDGLDELDMVEFYRHDANWSNRMILGDSLQVMASLAEREALRGKVQMIYIDPPYGIKFGSNWQVSTRKRDVKDGKREDATFEAEQIKAFRDTWELGIHSYLSYLRDRLVVARDLLTESGSCFVQIGDENVHLVRVLMDEVFGSENFCGLIAFQTTTGAGSPSVTTEVLPGVCDFLVWFARSRPALKYKTLFRSREAADDGNYRYVQEKDGSRRPISSSEALRPRADRNVWRANPLTSQTGGSTTTFGVEFEGRIYTPKKGGWKTNASGMERLRAARRLHASGNTLTFVRFFSDFPYQTYSNVWNDTRQSGFSDPKTYVVQTNARVIERCVLMTTDPGDLVLDPTCGSGTTAVVAEQWGRRWITIDTSRVSLTLARQRAMAARYPYYVLADSADGRDKEQELTGRAITAGAAANDVRNGFVYERVQHITLKSIANNPDIKEGMSPEEIDVAILRHADFELLYDKPYEDKRKVRVTGPFTVESLSPHRSLAFSGVAPDAIEATVDQRDGLPFEQMILDNLRTAGVQNGRKKERLAFETIEPYAGTHIQAVGTRSDTAADGPKRVAISIGPQYGTVSQKFIKDASRQAIADADIDLLCVLGFAFDPQAVGASTEYDGEHDVAVVAAERKLGRMPVLLVRMNNDLLMGEELKNTSTANLFTVFGEPDIAIERTVDMELVVTIRGVDVYDPTTGEVRSNGTDRVALWMIDTNYNGESFFVRHCYFTGGNDPYKRLKTALKAEIDEEAWDSLYRTTSRPFAPPETGRIAVKVINDYGDEVMQVFDV
jgi:adenine-specific DNA-methyltransferase